MRVNRVIFPGFQVGEQDPAEAERLVEAGVGGFCLYGGKASEVAALTRRLQARSGGGLLFCADYEDGAASHVRGATALPPNMALGASGDAALSRLKGRVTALEARALGVAWVLAPDVDLCVEPANPIVNVRSFGEDPVEVSRLASAYLEGLREGGALGCLKHFPGHGRTVGDSHLELPLVPAGPAALRRDLAPYARLGPRADAVMLAHLRVRGLDAGLPASLSPRANGVLRRLGFRGLVVTDALDMRAISRRFDETEAARLALLAGAHVLLVPKDPRALARSLPRLVESDPRLRAAADRALARLESFAARVPARRPADWRRVVGCPAHRRAAERIARAAMVRLGPRAPAPRALRYLEAEEGPARGRFFLDELRRLGVRARPFRGPGPEPLAAAVFLRPRAYSGRIRLEGRALARLRGALARERGAVLLSFGSPFVFDELPRWSVGLCAFTGIEAAQRAAARVLAGRAPAPGRMPVRLNRLGRRP
ncbi:MAG: glycoside hydrolase family 3 N-terminal domain-containing protein [Elusimicrobiota bacterium]|jgi:beta-glucosidase-like glycosyl hydrolase